MKNAFSDGIQKHTEYCAVVACTFSSDSWPYDDTPGSQLKAGDLAMRQLELHLMLNHRPNQPKVATLHDTNPVLIELTPRSLTMRSKKTLRACSSASWSPNLMGRAEQRSQEVGEALEEGGVEGVRKLDAKKNQGLVKQ